MRFTIALVLIIFISTIQKHLGIDFAPDPKHSDLLAWMFLIGLAFALFEDIATILRRAK